MARGSAGSEAPKRDAGTKLAQQRLSVVELARELGNVAEACRRRGLDRTSFYEWKRWFQTQGFEGLKDLPPIHKIHPQTTPEPVVARIRALALEHPAYGCNRLEAMLALGGAAFGDHHPEDPQRPWARDARRPLACAGEGPRREGHRDHSRAGSLPRETQPLLPRAPRRKRSAGRALVGRHLFVGSLKGVGKVYLHAAVDTHGS